MPSNNGSKNVVQHGHVQSTGQKKGKYNKITSITKYKKGEGEEIYRLRRKGYIGRYGGKFAFVTRQIRRPRHPRRYNNEELIFNHVANNGTNLYFPLLKGITDQTPETTRENRWYGIYLTTNIIKKISKYTLDDSRLSNLSKLSLNDSKQLKTDGLLPVRLNLVWNTNPKNPKSFKIMVKNIQEIDSINDKLVLKECQESFRTKFIRAPKNSWAGRLRTKAHDVANSKQKPVANSKQKPVANSKKKPVANSKIKPVANSKKKSVANSKIKPVANSKIKLVANSKKKLVANSKKEHDVDECNDFDIFNFITEFNNFCSKKFPNLNPRLPPKDFLKGMFVLKINYSKCNDFDIFNFIPKFKNFCSKKFPNLNPKLSPKDFLEGMFVLKIYYLKEKENSFVQESTLIDEKVLQKDDEQTEEQVKKKDSEKDDEQTEEQVKKKDSEKELLLELLEREIFNTKEIDEKNFSSKLGEGKIGKSNEEIQDKIEEIFDNHEKFKEGIKKKESLQIENQQKFPKLGKNKKKKNSGSFNFWEKFKK